VRRKILGRLRLRFVSDGEYDFQSLTSWHFALSSALSAAPLVLGLECSSRRSSGTFLSPSNQVSAELLQSFKQYGVLGCCSIQKFHAFCFPAWSLASEVLQLNVQYY